MTFNDIALIRLDRLANTVLSDPTFEEIIMPACLPTPYYGTEEPKIKNYLVSGWGLTESDDEYTSVLKKGAASYKQRQLEIPLYDKSVCYNIFPGVDETHICAGGEYGKDSCNGDR